MKKLNLFICSLAAIVCFSCDKLPSEQFNKTVLITRNGYQDVNLAYSLDSSTVTSLMSISVNGTSKNGSDIQVELGINADTLAGYNKDRFRYDTALYYKLLPADCYSMDSTGIVIKNGDEYTTLPIKFDLAKINKYTDYVLPISVKSVSAYQVAPPAYSTVLMHILLSNDFSGNYTDNGGTVDTSINSRASGSSTMFRVVDESTCFIYAGAITEVNPYKSKYKLSVHVNADSTVTMAALDPSINFVQEDGCKVQVSRAIDPLNANHETVTTKFYLKYKYDDDTTNFGFPVTMEYKANGDPNNGDPGTLIMLKTVSINGVG